MLTTFLYVWNYIVSLIFKLIQTVCLHLYQPTSHTSTLNADSKALMSVAPSLTSIETHSCRIVFTTYNETCDFLMCVSRWGQTFRTGSSCSLTCLWWLRWPSLWGTEARRRSCRPADPQPVCWACPSWAASSSTPAWSFWASWLHSSSPPKRTGQWQGLLRDSIHNIVKYCICF